MTEEIGWELYRSFLSVLDEGSLSAAARALGVAQPTMGRHIAGLEKALGVVLFTRSQTGFMPTDAAQELRVYAESMNNSVAALKRAAESHGEGVRGTVRVTASDVVGIELLPPIITGLREKYPTLAVELVLTDRVQDLLRREADIAVRMLRPTQGSLVAQRVGAIDLGLHAHQRYLDRHGAPATVADLAKHALIGFDQPTAFVRNAGKNFAAWQRTAFALRTDNNLGQLALIRAGAGIGFCQSGIARRDASLVRVLPKQFSMQLDTWITMHADLRNSPRCRVTFDTLLAGLRAQLRRETSAR
jgi:DNA-binding transcriptional LysR family regulator